MNTKAFKNTIIVSIFLIFFLLFTPIAVVRYISIFFLGIFIFNIAQWYFVPRFIKVIRITDTLRGIRLQDLTVEIKVVNKSIFPVPYITASDATGGLFSKDNAFIFNLPPFGSKILTYTCKGQKRGQYMLGPVELEGTDTFCLYKWKRKVPEYSDVLVYPLIYSLELINKKGLPAGSLNINNKLYEDVTQFRSLREYIPGDEIKRINWKASAKTGKLYTMEFDATLYFPVLIVLNLCSDDYPRRQRESFIERAIEVAASVAYYFTGLKQKVGFVSSGLIDSEQGYTIVHSRQGYEHAQIIIEKLAKISAVSKKSADFQDILFKSGVKIPMGTRVMIISPRVNKEQAQALLAAHRKGIYIEMMEITTILEKQEENHLKSVIEVLSIKERGEELIHG